MKSSVYHHSYDKLLSHIQLTHKTILDVACGPGNITNYLLNKRDDFMVLGIDAAESMIKLAFNNNSKANFKVLDCRNIKHLNKKFDIIIFGFCFPYISKEDVLQIITDAHLLLNKNGLLYISTMMGNYDNDSCYKTSSDGKSKIFIHYYTPTFLLKALHNNNFQVIENYTKTYQEGAVTTDTDLFLIAKK